MANKAKPTALKVIQGTVRNDRSNKNEPSPDSRMPKCPAWVNRHGKREWKRLLTELDKFGIATGFDFVAFAVLCNMWGEYIDGVQSGDSVSIAHITQMRLYLIEFGLTPSSRSKVSSSKKEKNNDPWDDL